MPPPPPPPPLSVEEEEEEEEEALFRQTVSSLETSPLPPIRRFPSCCPRPQ